jgi:ethanolaminephosphotransferase
MMRSRRLKISALAVSNILLPIALLVFATGFFPYKPLLPGLAAFEDTQDGSPWTAEKPEPAFDRVVFMVVDALRSDFVYGYNSGFEFTQRYSINPPAANYWKDLR